MTTHRPTLLGAALRCLGPCIVGNAIGLSIATWWPQPVNRAVVWTASFDSICIGVYVGIYWSLAYARGWRRG